MAKQNMNFEIIPKLESAVDMLEYEMIPNIKKGLENTEELISAQGVETLSKSFDNAKGGIEECVVCFTELATVLHAVLEQYKKARAFSEGV